MELKRDRLLQGGRYRIIESIGRGGFGVTYLAEQVMAKRKVCIKEFFPKDYYKRDGDTGALTLSSDGFGEMMGKFKTKFVKEAQTIATLNHANIIPIHDIFEENGTAYYVMEYIEGESLSERVKCGGAMCERDAVAYIKQVASALEHIHEPQIMHLDVKPSNIMVRSKDNRAILIDFGLSKHYDATSGEATSTTPVGVSHGFAPMEQYQDGGVSTFSPETDIYSLGATLYYLVTGNVPPQATVVAEQGLPNLEGLSSNIRETIAKSMSYWRKDRPHTIKEFLALLDNDEPIVAVLADESEKTEIVPHKPSSKRESNEDKPKQKKSRWWLWLLLLLLIGGVAYLMFMGGDNAAPVSNTTNTTKHQLDTFEQIDSDSTTLNQLRQDSINMAIRDNAIRDSIARAERERLVRDSTDWANAEAEQKKREKEAEQQRIAEQKKREEAARQAEQQRLAEEEAARQAEQQHLAEQKKKEEAARQAEQQRIDNMVAQGLGRDGVYQIGDYYNRNFKEGVVFWVTDGGRHGKIVSLDETELKWCTDKQYKREIALGLTSKSDGKANTNKVMRRRDSDQYPAFVWCRGKGEDWYLPAKEELEAICNNKSKINSTLAKYGVQLEDDWYWSSTEPNVYPEFWAWFVNMTNGYPDGNPKSFDYYVRAVSTF